MKFDTSAHGPTEASVVGRLARLGRTRRDASLREAAAVPRADGRGSRTITAGRRLTGLDGLRGIAALVVVLHHLALTNSDLAAGYRAQDNSGAPVWQRLVVNSPVHLLWQGTEAVFLFFVLSGLVLTLPRLYRTGGWTSYYAARLVRLYVPVWVALALATAVVVLVYPRVPAGVNWWLDQHFGLGLADASRDAFLVLGVSNINSPLWSLQWEVLFSLLLPGYVWIARACTTPVRAVSAVIGFIGVMVVGKLIHVEAMQYLPIFALGALIAVNGDALAEVFARVSRIRGARSVLFVIALALLNAEWVLRGISGVPALVLDGTRIGVLAACCVLVWLAAGASSASASPSILARGPVRWLGVRSFSLYLVHEPIVVSVAVLTGGRSTALVATLALPAALLAAEIFYRVVERPAHRLSRRVGSVIGGHSPQRSRAGS